MTRDEAAALRPGDRIRMQAMRWFAAANDRARPISDPDLPEPAAGIAVRAEMHGVVVRPWRSGAGMSVRWDDERGVEELGEHDLQRLAR